MKYELFENIILNLKKVEETSQKFYDLGLDISNIEDEYSKIITNLLGAYYSKVGLDWIEWFLYERVSFDGEIGEATDENNNQICFDIKSTWEFIENIKNSEDFEDFELKMPMTDEQRMEILTELFTKNNSGHIQDQ